MNEQETLEKAAENYGWRIKRNTFSDVVKVNELANSAKQDFIEGAKWQQERSYSEEDMIKAFEAGYRKGFSGYPNTENWKELPFKEWFKQLKKK